MTDPAAFDRPELGALWTELRRRFEAAGDGEVRTVRLARLGPAERSALADLLGLVRLPGEPATVAVARVDDAVRRGCGLGARELIERLHGPLRDRPGERAAAAAERAELAALEAAGRRDLWALHGVTGRAVHHGARRRVHAARVGCARDHTADLGVSLNRSAQRSLQPEGPIGRSVAAG